MPECQVIHSDGRGQNLRILSFEETLDKARQNFGPEKIGKINSWSLEYFIEEHVRVVHREGIDAVIIDQEWNQPFFRGYTIDPVLECYIESARTKGVMVEYFNPELIQNAQNTPFIGRKLAQMYASNTRSERTYYSQQLAQVIQEAGKKAFVADIANKPTYQVLKILSKDAGIPALVASPWFPPEIQPLIWAYAALAISGAVQETKGVGMFDKTKIHGFEKFIPDIEDARRLYGAAGIEQLMAEYATKSTEEGEKDAQLVIVYPIAHARRITDYLVNPSRARAVKKALYRLMPGLDFSVRTWEWKDTLTKGEDYSSPGGWERTSNKMLV